MLSNIHQLSTGILVSRHNNFSPGTTFVNYLRVFVVSQILELCEGQAYAVGGLVPSSSDSGILYLQARGSPSDWLPLSPMTIENFE